MPTILLTNIVLANRSGTEVVTEQLADGLRRHGHRVLIYTPAIGTLAEQMRARGHVVVDSAAALLSRPDIIHAHHNVAAMAALAAYPGTPALFVCHDATAPFDSAPLHPQVRRLFAVDERCKARLVTEGAAAADVALLPNAVDLRRIPPREGPPSGRPHRAIVSARSKRHLSVLREACARHGITLEEFGHGAGRVTGDIETRFSNTDLVFATARTAIEASAAGAGVIVCDERGCAGFLTRERAEAWLPWNLGAGVLKQPTDAAAVDAAIGEWSSAEAVAAAAYVRDERPLEALLDRLEAIYQEIVRTSVVIDAQAESAAISAFISQWVPSFNLEAPWRQLAKAVSPTNI